MILHGNQRGGSRQMALHLLNTSDNEHVTVHEVSGFISEDVLGALNEAYALSKATKATQFMYSLSLNPPEGEEVPVSYFEEIIARVEKELTLEGQARVIVFHEKKGRRHAHCVWSRIDLDTMTAINMYKDWEKLNGISKDIFLEQGWSLPEGFVDKDLKNPLNFTREEWEQAQRTGRSPAEIKKSIQEAWAISDCRASFEHALEERGFYLAVGDRKSYTAIVIDLYGEVHSLRTKLNKDMEELAEFLGERKTLRTVSKTQKLIASKLTQKFAQYHDELVDQYEQDLKALNQKKEALAEHHAKERQGLADFQEQRGQEEIKQRQSRFNSGLGSLFDRLSGKHKAIEKWNAWEAKKATKRDRLEQDKLIFRQLSARRELQQQIRSINDTLNTKLDALKRDFTRFNELQFEFRTASPELNADPSQPLITPDKDVKGLKAEIRRNPETILDVMTEHEESFTHNDIVKALEKHIDDPERLAQAIESVLASKELLIIETAPVTRYSTHEMQEMKTSIADHAKSMSRNKSHGVPARFQRNAIKQQDRHLQQQYGARLSQEQRQAIKHLLGKEQISVANGLAGAGKSTMLEAANHAWQEQGRRVFGAAPSGKAADGLQDASGIESRTLASWELSWKNGHNQLQAGDVFVVDEAGMVGSKQMLSVMEEIKAKEAKLVLVGDPEQLQSIQAGTPMRDISNDIGSANLTEILRQKEDWQRQASLDFAQGRTKEAMAAYELRGAVSESTQSEKATEALAHDYCKHMDEEGTQSSRIALAYHRKDVHELNQLIRAKRQEEGYLWDEHSYQTKHGPRKLATDDRMVFTRNDKELGIRNGSLGTVKSLDSENIKVELDAEKGQEPQSVTIAPNQYQDFDHGYAITIHKSQGMTVDQSFVLDKGNMDRHLTYVAMSRHKEEAKVYVDKPNSFEQQQRVEFEKMKSEPVIQPSSEQTLEV